MIVDSVRIPRITGHIRAGHGPQGDGGPVRKDQPIPGHKYALLPVNDAGIIDAVELCAARNQQLLPRACVEHILTDLRDNGSRQIGIDPREHDAGDHRPGFDFKRLPRRPRVRQNPSRIPRRRAIKKSLLVFVGGGIVAVIPQRRGVNAVTLFPAYGFRAGRLRRSAARRHTRFFDGQRRGQRRKVGLRPHPAYVVSFLLIGGFLAVIPDHYQRFRLA